MKEQEIVTILETLSPNDRKYMMHLATATTCVLYGHSPYEMLEAPQDYCEAQKVPII
jgi:hypothetical protein